MIKVKNRLGAGRIINFPRNPFEEGDWVIISISDRFEVDDSRMRYTFATDIKHDYEDNKVALASLGCVDALFTAFSDSLPGDPGPIDLLDKERATEIARFIHKHLDKNFVVHCNAGISRSGAVGRFIALLTDDIKRFDAEFGKRIFPNAHVHNMLREAWQDITGDLVF